MEQEYKWKISDEECIKKLVNSKSVKEYCTDKQKVHMQAIYYDTKEGIMKDIHGALRTRIEGDISVCCLKLATKVEGACKTREEYEIKSGDIYLALEKFPENGAPAKLCNYLKNSELIELCRTNFWRKIYNLRIELPQGECIAELDFDIGTLSRNSNVSAFSELEFEFKEGNADVFHIYAKLIEQKFKLVSQPLSKMARAMSL